MNQKGQLEQYQYVETTQQLEAFAQANREITWMGFDTEFMTERRFYPMLCLIQVITEQGMYLIDPIALPQLEPFLAMLIDDRITKITHAGDNDYRILNALYGIYPRNLFDTQIAMGFLSHTYPISFQNLVEKELRITLDKSFSVTDWQARPMTAQQVNYALNDVVHLPLLWQRLTEQLNQYDRLHWCQEEVAKWTTENYYAPDSLQDLFKSTTHTQLTVQERVFLVRLMQWRSEAAQKRNVPQETILSKKMMMPIVKSMRQGLSHLRQNRMISDKLIQSHGKQWEKLFKATMNDAEKEAIQHLKPWKEETPEELMTSEFLYLLIRDRCFKAGVANAIVVPKSSFRSQSQLLATGWRRELLGDSLIEWLQADKVVAFDVQSDRCVVQFLS
jgi:ribonuclease D